MQKYLSFLWLLILARLNKSIDDLWVLSTLSHNLYCIKILLILTTWLFKSPIEVNDLTLSAFHLLISQCLLIVIKAFS